MTLIDSYKNFSLPGRIIAITVAVWLSTQLWRLFLVLFVVSGYDWQDALALHSNLRDFWLTPWTLFTYMWVHADLGVNLFHLVFNMLWLWWFGTYFLRWHTGRQFLGVYILGGLFAGIFFLLVYNVFPYFALERQYTSLIGASGAIFGLVAAVAVARPNEQIQLNLIFTVFPLTMKWLALITFGISLLNISSNTGGIVCHIGGALWGVIYALSEQRGTDLTGWFNRTGDWIANLFKRTPRMKATPGGARPLFPGERARDVDYNARKRARQEQIDHILEKISRHGYDALTAEEKQLLFDASRKH